MKILQWGIKNIYRLTVCTLIALTFWKVYSLTVPETVAVLCDNNLCHKVRCFLKERVSTLKVRSLGAKGLLQELKQEYPFLSTVTIAYKCSDKAYVSIKAEQPCIVLEPVGKGEPFVLTAQGSVVPKRYFNEAVTETSAHISMQAPDFVQQLKKSSAYTSLLALRPEIFDQYTIVWRSKEEILLGSRMHNDFFIVADTVSIHEKEKFAYAKQVYENRGSTYVKGMKVDIRLKDSLICGPPVFASSELRLAQPGGGLFYEKSNCNG